MKKRIEKIAAKRGYIVTEKGLLLNPSGKEVGKGTNHDGYFFTTIRIDKKPRHLKVHRLQAFQKYGNELFKEGIEVRHFDGNKGDNSWDNILIGTHSNNMMDIPKQIRIKKAQYATSFTRKYNKKEIKKYHRKDKSYEKTMKKFNISSKGTLHYILNN